jgi:hypothetical protein
MANNSEPEINEKLPDESVGAVSSGVVSMSHNGQSEELVRRARNGWRLVVVWTIALPVVGFFAASMICGWLQNNRITAELHHREKMNPLVLESGITAEEAALPVSAHPVEVQAGIYVDRISELSLKDASWTVDFYVWFRWRGDVPRLGEDFQVVDGTILDRKKDDEYVAPDEHYQRYRVMAKITKFFDATRFPVDDHLLTINIEHPAELRSQMIFVDDGTSSISSRAQVWAYGIKGLESVEKPHVYRTSRGDPRVPAGFRPVYSQFRVGISLVREGWGFFLKMFQGLFASLAVAMTVFVSKPSHLDTRFSIGVGAFFATIANVYITSSLIPNTGVLTLADVMNGLAMITIFLTMVQSFVSIHVYDGRGNKELALKYDHVSFWLFAGGTVAMYVAICLAATS